MMILVMARLVGGGGSGCDEDGSDDVSTNAG